jgi:antibiotic biosynthesis monooxygenase (ABM) superfamily enzyme
MMGPQDPDPQRSATIPRYKLAVIIWLAIYPALTATLAVLGPVITPWPLFLRTLLMTAILVPTMVYLLIRGMQRIFAGWLRPRPRARHHPSAPRNSPAESPVTRFRR